PSFLALCGFIEDIACGRVDPESRARLLSCTLIAARKKNGGVRPIALSEVFVRLASLCCLRLLPSSFLADLFAPLQLGVGSSNGVELAIHTLQDHLERHPNHTLRSLDYVNGFNSMFRHVMLQQLYAQPGLAVLWRLTDFCSGASSALFLFDRGNLVSSFESQRGARQGCVLGSLLFCLGLQAALLEATHDLPEVTLKAYV